jgi:D-lactate dehydrogenase
VQAAVLRLCDRAGVEVRIPDGIAGLCCGSPWQSKGLDRGHEVMREQVLRRLRDAEGLPVVVDASSCTEGLTHLLARSGHAVVDVVAFADEILLPRLPTARRVPSVVLHPTCSSTRLGLDPALVRLASAAAHQVTRPDDWGCCAFAGDRGLLHPELTASATRAEAAEVVGSDAAAHVSLNRTCEVGMTRATGHPYRHVLELLEEVTRPA